MATYIEIGGNRYAATITGRLSDKDWNNRESKAIRLAMSYEDAIATFVDDAKWNIIQDCEVRREVVQENGDISYENIIEQEVYDNSEYSLAGEITDHRDGTVTVKMGKLTAAEVLAILIEEV